MRTARPVDRDKLVAAITTAEAEKTTTLSAFYEKVVSVYNEGTDTPITTAIAKLRVDEWKIEIHAQKGSKGKGKRPATEVDRTKLEAAVQKADSENLNGLSAVYKAAADYYNADAEVRISPAIAGARIEEWGIFLKTKKGKKGQGGTRPATKVDREKLEAAIQRADDGSLNGFSLLYRTVAEFYNEGTEIPITPAIVSSRIAEWGISLKTQKGKLGRSIVGVEVNREKLEAAVQRANADNLCGASNFYKAASDYYNADAEVAISPSTVMGRIKLWNIPFTAQEGKRGRQIEVDQQVLTTVLQEIYAQHPTGKIPNLFAQVAEAYAAKTGTGVSAITLQKRAEQWNLERPEVKATEPAYVSNLSPAPTSKFDRPIAVDVASSRHYQACGCHGLNVMAPAGDCPAKLPDTELASVEGWVNRVIEAGHKRGLHFGPSALKYFVRQFYDLGSDNYHLVCSHVEEIFSRDAMNLSTDEHTSVVEKKMPVVAVPDVDDDLELGDELDIDLAPVDLDLEPEEIL